MSVSSLTAPSTLPIRLQGMAVSSTSWDCRPAQSTPSTSLCPTSLAQCGSTPQSDLSLVSWCKWISEFQHALLILPPPPLPRRPSLHPTSGPHPHCWWTDCPTDCHVPWYQGGYPPVLHLNVTITSQQTSDRTAAPPCYRPDHSNRW